MIASSISLVAGIELGLVSNPAIFKGVAESPGGSLKPTSETLRRTSFEVPNIDDCKFIHVFAQHDSGT